MPVPGEEWREDFHKELKNKDPARFATWQKNGEEGTIGGLDRDLVLVSDMRPLARLSRFY